MINKRRRVFIFLAALAFAVVILGSLAFIASSSQHDCSGEECSVCEMIQQCEKLLHTMAGAVKSCISHYAVIFAVTAVMLCGRVICSTSTLISLKVELLA